MLPSSMIRVFWWRQNFSDDDQSMPISSIEEALLAFAKGEFLIVIDDPSRENEGDLIISAAHLTPKKMAFMIRYTSGLICVPMSEDRLVELGLPDMVERNEESLRTAYTISCDARHGVTTGISATDRARTCNILASPDSVRPLLCLLTLDINRSGSTRTHLPIEGSS